MLRSRQNTPATRDVNLPVMKLCVCKPILWLHGHVQDAWGNFGRHCEGVSNNSVPRNLNDERSDNCQVPVNERSEVARDKWTTASHRIAMAHRHAGRTLPCPDDICRQPLMHHSSRRPQDKCPSMRFRGSEFTPPRSDRKCRVLAPGCGHT